MHKGIQLTLMIGPAVPIPVPKAGTFPSGTVFYWQGFAIDGSKIISSDLYESEVR